MNFVEWWRDTDIRNRPAGYYPSERDLSEAAWNAACAEKDAEIKQERTKWFGDYKVLNATLCDLQDQKAVQKERIAELEQDRKSMMGAKKHRNALEQIVGTTAWKRFKHCAKFCMMPRIRNDQAKPPAGD